MKIHFIGIEGVSMRVLAEMERKRGHTVTGSDAVTTGHDAKFVEGADLVVYTNAVSANNVELVRAKESGIPVIERAHLLGELAGTYRKVIAVAGSHGKTTTTGMLWKVFSPLNPTVHIGGSMEGQCGCAGSDDWFITEACEYNRSFLHIKPSVAIILNIDLDHTDCYKSISDLTASFKSFAAAAAERVIVNGDDINSATLSALKNVTTVGLSDACDYYAACLSKDQLGNYRFCVHKRGGKKLGSFALSVSGKHNVYNALACIACADFYGMTAAQIAQGLKGFAGMERRFEYVGAWEGVKIFSDYAHHPKEITSSLSTAKTLGFQSVTVVFEPHTFSRTKSFLQGFCDALSIADHIIVSPIYPSREQPMEGVSSHNIVRKLIEKGKDALYLDTYYSLIRYLKQNRKEGDMVIFMGAGDIDKAARIMVDKSFYKQTDQALSILLGR